ncbi:MAG: recombination protein O N-terminal domain-containing protein [Victivallales bacterium]|nr:recombination protein O N-terminal domain-containing protein [Victivallales bacterium]
MGETASSDFLVLRKLLYGENALIVSGLSPEFGTLAFLVRGAAGGPHRSFPELDLFRLLHVEFVLGKGELHRVTSASLLEDFGALANSLPAYNAACWIANLSLRNVMPMLPHPHFSNAVEVALRRLAHGGVCTDAVLTGVCLAFLFEEGWLAHAVTTPEATEQCRQILEMAAGNPPPAITEESWAAQLAWAKELLLLNDCKLP